MKYRDGYWNIRTNVQLLNKVDIVDVHQEAGTLTIYTAAKRIDKRGATLNTPMLTTVVSSPLPDVLHVRSYHFKGALDRGPHFSLQPDQHKQMIIEQMGTAYTVRSGELSLSVGDSGPADLSFFYQDRLLTTSSGQLSGHAVLDGQDAYQLEYLSLGVGETIYGLGERFTPFVKNGQVVDIWNEDGGTSSEQAYKNIPFYLSSRGYGVLVANPGRVSFEVGSEVVTSVQFSVPGQCLDYYVIGAKSLKDVLGKYTELSGRPALVPAWSFGLWLTTSFVTSYDEQTVNRFIDGMAEHKIPLHVFHFDCFWMEAFQWVDFTWDAKQFSDPPAMLARLHSRNLKVCVWINPYVAQKSALFDEGLANGYLVHNLDGSVWQWDRWQAGMGLVDFTNADAVRWYQGKLKALLDMGVDTFKTDFGERIPTSVQYADGSDPMKMHNYYTYLYNKAVFELLEQERGTGDALVFARSATVGGQKFPVHWGGDCSATYESMAESLRGGLSLSLSGFGYWSHDIGGFEKRATPDLFKRWIAFGLLSSHSRLHGNESYRVPWDFDEQSSEVLKYFVELKCSLMPYLFHQACDAHVHGLPIMRAMVLEFPDDPVCAFLDRQYCLGEHVLVAPVFQDDGKVSYYLPKGRWTHLLNNREVSGGSYQSEVYDYFSLPLFVRPNSILAIGSEHAKPDYDYADQVTFHVFALEEGARATAVLNDLGGAVKAICTVTHAHGSYQVRIEGTIGSWAVCLRNIQAVQSTDQGRVAFSPDGVVVQLTSEQKACTIRI
ncbi:MAG: alpha-xylosidase [Sphaerochaeta sp.]|uniref:alpha-xylosidase n=1 Tax=Sphaerochaeta sp. TaxID=1972642 RepID=UPI003D12FFCA